MEENRETGQFDLIGAVIEAIAVILGVAVLAHITINIRLCHPMHSTKTIISQVHQLGFWQILIEIIKAYYIYMLLGLILAIAVFYTLRMAGSRLSVVPALPGRFSGRFLKPAVILLLLFYIANLVVSTQFRRQYTTFYEGFKAGNQGETGGNDFMGYTQYHFLNHAHEAKRILTQLSQQAQNQEERAVVEDVLNLVKAQDRNLSAFRSYLANYALVFKITHILQYCAGLLASLGISILLALHCCFLGGQRQSPYGSLQQVDEQGSQQSLVKCPQEDARLKCCLQIYILIVLVVLSGAILCAFVVGDVLMQLKTGHPYNNNLQQTDVCSFHSHVGGIFINIDYQLQLQLAQEYRQLDSQFGQSDLMDSLGNYLEVYLRLCETLQPYYVEHKGLQGQLAELFYRHFYAFVFLLWSYSRALKDLKAEQ